VDAAIILLFLGIFPEPGASVHIITSNGVNPEVIASLFLPVIKNIYPRQNIFPALGPPPGYIFRIG
jgi:hypothetical protein